MVPMHDLCGIFKALYYSTTGKPLWSVSIMKYLVNTNKKKRYIYQSLDRFADVEAHFKAAVTGRYTLSGRLRQKRAVVTETYRCSWL